MGKKTKKAAGKHVVQTSSSGVKHGKENVAGAPPQYSVDQILEKVDMYMDEFQFELAQRFCQRALEMEPDNPRVLETSGTLLLELGEMDKAKHCFGRAIEVNPDEGHSKYMYLGQLLVGTEAINCFHKGIELMKQRLELQNSQAAGEEAAAAIIAKEDEVTQNDVSSAYCSIAEIYLTDACDEDEAESRCKECLDAAIKADELNPEAYQLMASYHLSKEDKKAAREVVEKGVSLWLPDWREADKPEGDELDPIEFCKLSYPARMTAAKTLIEVESYDIAGEILELLLDEEDQVVETWYLLGWLNFLQGEDYKVNARYYLKRANQVISKTKYDGEEVIQHITQLLDDLGPGDDGEEDVEAGDAEKDEDQSTDDEDEEDRNGMDVEMATEDAMET